MLHARIHDTTVIETKDLKRRIVKLTIDEPTGCLYKSGKRADPCGDEQSGYVARVRHKEPEIATNPLI